MFVEERLNLIIEILERDGRVRVKDLSKQFNVSESMIRKDLKVLEKKNLLQRTYGGAINIVNRPVDLESFNTRIIKNIDLTITHVFDYAKTNLRTGDIIKKINEASVKTYEELSEELAKYTSGEKLNIIVSRNNKTTACYAQLSTKENNVPIIPGINLPLLEVS